MQANASDWIPRRIRLTIVNSAIRIWVMALDIDLSWKRKQKIQHVKSSYTLKRRPTSESLLRSKTHLNGFWKHSMFLQNMITSTTYLHDSRFLGRQAVSYRFLWRGPEIRSKIFENRDAFESVDEISVARILITAVSLLNPKLLATFA
jgi:hypothetical protein